MKLYSLLGAASFGLCLQMSICSTAAAGTFDTPPLALQPYEKLHMPPQLPRAEVQWMLERAVEELDQKAFVDFGDMSDFMHAHVIFEHEPGLKLEKSINDLSWVPPWESMAPVVALFHTQEYDNFRNKRPYRNRAGKIVSAEHRNQLLWLKDTKWTKRGEVISARHFARPNRVEEYTISPVDLDEKVAGPNAREFDFSFYFFRAHCPDVDALLRKGMRVEESNVLELKVGGKRACVALVNFYCRNYPNDQRQCPEANLRPFYTPSGAARYRK